ncbi:hypothetical protein BH24GEM3_BH24GEM3_16770 [soil metagenome]
MDGQFYSLAFRERFSKFNGLIWAYHWLQIGLYEPLLVGRNVDERQALVRATVARFWQMLENAPETMPYLMPMTAAVSPRFTERYPEISIIFDNLHMMHDVVSDILASDQVPRNRKRAEILRAIELFRDDTSHVTTVNAWRQMAVGMGTHNQGGPAVGFLTALPTPTVPRGMSMAGMDHVEMDHEAHDDHAAHAAPAQPGHDGHATPAMDPEMHQAMEFIVRLLSDPRIKARIHADPRLHQLWADPEVQQHLQMMRRMHGPGAEGDQRRGVQQPGHRHQQPEDQHQHHQQPQPRNQPQRR